MAEKKEKSSEALSLLQKKYGAGVVLTPLESSQYDDHIEFIPTGSLVLDRAIANGGNCMGIPKDGRVTMIVGPNSVGKSTLAYSIAKNAQKQGNGMVLIVDSEKSFSLDYAITLGLDPNKIHVINEEILLKALGVKTRNYCSAEEISQFIADALIANDYELIILDSLSSLIPNNEAFTSDEAEPNKAGNAIGSFARAMGKAYRLWSAATRNTKSAYIYLNQFRTDLGVLYGDNNIPTGGKSLQYLNSLVIKLSRKLDKDGTDVHGLTVTAKIDKSKVSKPHGVCSYYLELGQGISYSRDVLSLCLEQGLITRGGSYYTLPEVQDKIQGEKAVLNFLEANELYMGELVKKLK